MTIVEFLEARLAEDEAVALKAGGAEAEWLYRAEFDRETGGEVVWANSRSEMERRGSLPPLVTYDRYVTMDHEGCLPAVDEDDGPHIARHDPARILREVAAKQAVLKAHCRIALHAGGGAKYYETRRVCRSCEPLHGVDDCWPCPTVLHIAAIYSSHPDYQKEWAL